MTAFPAPQAAITALRARVTAREPVIGTFVKSTAPQTAELLARADLDFAVLDAEHAPFDLGALDGSIGAARGAGLPAVVRVPDHGAVFVNSCLDMGAAGVLVPHTRSADEAEAIVDAVKYARGKRGFSSSGRAGDYGQVDGAAYRAEADRGSSIWVQVEDAAALDQLDAIADVDGVDCLFVGPADLALSLGYEGPGDPRLAEVIGAIAAAARRRGRAAGLFVAHPAAIPAMRDLGITLFVCGSDQSLLLGAARHVAGTLTR